MSIEDSLAEFWKPLYIRGSQIDNYFVSSCGRISLLKGGDILYPKIYNHSYRERGNYQSVKIFGKTERVHRLVAETFLPLHLYPPIPLDDWNSTPQSAKDLIRDTLLVDHIDCDPFNNHVSNLRWVTPKQNNSFFKKRLA